MAMTLEQVEHEFKQLETVCRELTENMARLQRRVAELEKEALEEVGEYDEAED